MPRQQRVHVVFKTHLDLGFTDLTERVVERYLDDFLPRALALARDTRLAGGDRFVWTTGSWLIDHALERYRGARRRALEDGIAAGDVRWHALPFTTHSGLMDAPLFRCGLGIAAALDRRFGRRTIAAKMTDVPGHTRGIVPLLAEAGVSLLHIGVNPVCRMPEVPRLFHWQADSHGIDVVYDGDYGQHTAVPGGGVLAFGFTGDNHGPPPPERIAAVYGELRARFPGALVAATSLDDFAGELAAARQRLPVLRDEIGDSWIHGAASDPGKLAGFRALQRLHARLRGAAAPSPRTEAFGRALLLVPEHTWGLDIKTHLSRIFAGTPAARAAARRRDGLRYRPAAFRAALRTAPYRTCIASWQEQRGYLKEAVAALGRGSAGREAHAALAEALHPPAPPPPAGLRGLPDGRLDSGRWEVAVDLRSGAITRLIDRATGRIWADRTHHLARFRHQTFSAADYARWLREYTRDLDRHRGWAIPDLAKPGMESVPPRSGFAGPARVRVRGRADPTGLSLRLDLAMPSALAVRGCPRQVQLALDLPAAGDEAMLTLWWQRKTATRLPEASWLDLRPCGIAADSWRLVAMGQRIDPQAVVRGGGRHLHAVEAVEADGLAIEPLDAALVAPGGPRLLRADHARPRPEHGISFNLHNNVWGTNFPMWYGEDARFRFRLRLTGAA